ncbi:2'-5' RNA ligase [Candidatus Kaiserbacteria bacterium RIFCSPLOWO2_01_FULL_53_17]|uniref:RNA 2',3'-cyclic phosphodiesterase n=1 Tax=Candidatus Kaiserbacteria bacterium RIFCSPLOWO2_01_FULL_53_17 TaxID=1798511 RepID=A0A1F6EGL4_9BACT|nr:MAG: 2'-5' RNA ligase [Candidatus Kaiserbacteria bacterium RIFCSPLOWO2_01_FULL_53_17]
MRYHNAKITKRHRPRVHRRVWGAPKGPARRVFIGIRLDNDVAETLTELQEGLPPIPMRRVPKADLHLTLTPPWMEKDVAQAAKRLRDALERPFEFELKFRRLRFGPDPADPFLIWVTCEASKELIELKNRLLKAFAKKEKERVPFTPHVTIARLRGSFSDSFREHHLRKVIPLTMTVSAVELMASPHQGGAGYETLKRVRLHREDETPH